MTGAKRDRLGALLAHEAVEIPGAPDRSLAGQTFVAKDNLDVAGHRTGAGHPDWRYTHPPAARTAPVIERLLAAGATLIGKTVMDELAFSLDGENVHDGAPVNPNAAGRVTGGSSSGSASAVAGGLAPFALGTDTGGSVRVPAGYCGIWGIRPTHGRVTTRGVVPLAPSFDTVGWLTRSADLLRRVGAVLLGDRRDAAPRGGPTESGTAATFSLAAGERPEALLVAEDGFLLADGEAREALRRALDDVAARLGLQRSAVRAVTVAPGGLAAWARCFTTLQALEVGQTHREWIERVRPVFGPGVRERFERALRLAADSAGAAAARIAAARRDRQAIRARMAQLLGDRRLLALPTAPFVAPRRGRALTVSRKDRERLLSLTCIAGLAGLPQVSLPLTRLEEGPVGLSLIGPPDADETLLQLACALE